MSERWACRPWGSRARCSVTIAQSLRRTNIQPAMSISLLNNTPALATARLPHCCRGRARQRQACVPPLEAGRLANAAAEAAQMAMPRHGRTPVAFASRPRIRISSGATTFSMAVPTTDVSSRSSRSLTNTPVDTFASSFVAASPLKMSRDSSSGSS